MFSVTCGFAGQVNGPALTAAVPAAISTCSRGAPERDQTSVANLLVLQFHICDDVLKNGPISLSKDPSSPGMKAPAQQCTTAERSPALVREGLEGGLGCKGNWRPRLCREVFGWSLGTPTVTKVSSSKFCIFVLEQTLFYLSILSPLHKISLRFLGRLLIYAAAAHRATPYS